ncbi:MAG: hypothetical protein IJ141_07505 [Lachnospiraceae bacterium]|nr:hypothetical protein [Lachnospiraceae bacterium]
MERYRKISFWATICVALFIINFAFCILCMNKTVYEKCFDNYTGSEKDIDIPIEASGAEKSDTAYEIKLESFEMKANFEKLSDDFKAFFKGKYELIGYELDEHNADRLNHIKWFYRLAWMVSIATFAGMLHCFIILSKRRMFTPFIYGGVLSAFFTAVNTVIFIRSDREFYSAARDMVFRENYRYFSDKDILIRILPPSYARWMAIAYLIFVAVLIVLMILIRWFILFCGRPHKF